MPTSTDEFWKLAVASGVLDSAGCQSLQVQFGSRQEGSQADDAEGLCDWLIGNGALSRYQASVLLSGRPGPFVFGDFIISERIETGRLARSFRAIYKRQRRALLVFASAAVDTPPQQRARNQQLEIARAIKSPHVALVYQFQAMAVPPFFVLENLEGQSLRELLRADQPAVEDACRIGLHAALGLAAMHGQRAMHGALCPDNVWIEASSTAKLLQFPLAVAWDGDARFGEQAVDYLAPELTEPGRAADPFSDIYALGCMLYELIAGRVPLAGGSVEQKLARHRTEVPQRLDQLDPGSSGGLADLVAQMLDKEPTSRPQTASHVAEVLASVGSGVPEHGTAPRNAVARASAEDPARKASGVGRTAAAPTAKAESLPGTSRPSHTTAETPTIVVGEPSVRPSVVVRPATPAVKRRRANSTAIAAGVGLALIAILALGAFLFFNRGSVSDSTASSVAIGSTSNPNTSAGDAVETAPAERLGNDLPAGNASSSPDDIREIDDDGRTLWMSPTAGAPLDVRYLPSSAQLIIALRPADLLATDEGVKLVAALGPAGETAIERLRATLGVEPTDLEQLTIAFAPQDAGRPQAAYRMRLGRAIPEAMLLRAWGNPRPAVHESQSFYQSGSLAYYLPADEEGRVVVIAPPPMMQGILEDRGDPLLRGAIESLLRTSDASRHFNVVATPSYLLTDGKTLLGGDLTKLRKPLERFFDMSMQGVLASAHVGDELFLELRAVGPSDRRPEQVAEQLVARLGSASEQLENYVGELIPQPYGRSVVRRFPQMVQLANSYTRWAAEDRQAVLRCYLPASAAHNLMLGAELTLFEEPGVSPGTPPATATSPPATAALDRVISLSFPRDTLERTMELLAGEIDTPITILGADLQLEGITKNQSFSLDERDQPARQVLLKVLELANPDGKLVYVIKLDPDGKEMLQITTRAAAGRRGDPLPVELDQKSPAKVP